MATCRYPERGSALLRRGRHSEPGRLYLVTFTTANRIPLFRDWETASAVARTLQTRNLWRGSRLLCWVLMPDHWHGLIELGEADELSRLVRRLKGVSARNVNRRHGSAGMLWAEGFHDHAVRAEESLVEIARYIVLNPVRAGLVRSVGAYAFWDAVWIDAEHRG